MTAAERAEAELTAYGLSLPQAAHAYGWAMTRNLRVRDRPFAMFGDKAQPLDQITIVLKLPISFEMVQDLWFVRESRGWWRQHGWVISHFGRGDDIEAEMDTLKAWIRQSYRAVATKKLAALVGEA